MWGSAPHRGSVARGDACTRSASSQARCARLAGSLNLSPDGPRARGSSGDSLYCPSRDSRRRTERHRHAAIRVQDHVAHELILIASPIQADDFSADTFRIGEDVPDVAAPAMLITCNVVPRRRRRPSRRTVVFELPTEAETQRTHAGAAADAFLRRAGPPIPPSAH